MGQPSLLNMYESNVCVHLLLYIVLIITKHYIIVCRRQLSCSYRLLCPLYLTIISYFYPHWVFSNKHILNLTWCLMYCVFLKGIVITYHKGKVKQSGAFLIINARSTKEIELKIILFIKLSFCIWFPRDLIKNEGWICYL